MLQAILYTFLNLNYLAIEHQVNELPIFLFEEEIIDKAVGALVFTVFVIFCFWLQGEVEKDQRLKEKYNDPYDN